MPPPERVAAWLTRAATYACVAFAGAFALHARAPSNPLGASFVVLYVGIVAFSAARAVVRRR